MTDAAAFLGHLRVAVRDHVDGMRDLGKPIPPDLLALEAVAADRFGAALVELLALTTGDTARQEATTLGDGTGPGDDDVMLLTLEETARRLRLSHRSVVRLIDRGDLRAVRPLVHPRVRRVDLDRYLEELQ